MTDQTNVPADATPIADLDQFAFLIRNWHHNGMSQLDHLQQVPEGQSISIQLEENGALEDLVLEGDLLKGFKAAMVVAMSIFHELPFGSAPLPEAEQNVPASSGD